MVKFDIQAPFRLCFMKAFVNPFEGSDGQRKVSHNGANVQKDGPENQKVIPIVIIHKYLVSVSLFL
jgi:hypothetical protein